MQYLTFRLAGVEYAVDVRIIETVVPYEESTPVPTRLPYMRGVMDLRGRVIPLIDLRSKLGLPPSADSDEASVIVFGVRGSGSGDGAADITVGAVVDGVSEVVTLGEAELEAATGGEPVLWERYVLGIARRENRMVVIIQPSGLFSLDELAAIRTA